jgi:hypothetical protein
VPLRGARRVGTDWITSRLSLAGERIGQERQEDDGEHQEDDPPDFAEGAGVGDREDHPGEYYPADEQRKRHHAPEVRHAIVYGECAPECPRVVVGVLPDALVHGELLEFFTFVVVMVVVVAACVRRLGRSPERHHDGEAREYEPDGEDHYEQGRAHGAKCFRDGMEEGHTRVPSVTVKLQLLCLSIL